MCSMIQTTYMGACGQVDKALDSRSKGLGFDSHCKSRAEVSGRTSHSILPLPTQSRLVYLVEQESSMVMTGYSCSRMRDC